MNFEAETELDDYLISEEFLANPYPVLMRLREEDPINIMSDILLSHDPPPQMASVLEGSLAQMEKHYAADPKAVSELIDAGEKKSDAAIPAPELAAWTMAASEMLNLDETITK
jgi:hypothetical protein